MKVLLDGASVVYIVHSSYFIFIFFRFFYRLFLSVILFLACFFSFSFCSRFFFFTIVRFVNVGNDNGNGPLKRYGSDICAMMLEFYEHTNFKNVLDSYNRIFTFHLSVYACMCVCVIASSLSECL